MQIQDLFSAEDIDEIDAFKELAEGVSVNGEELICFSVLSDIVHGNVLVNEISAELICKTSHQLSWAREVLTDMMWFDSVSLDAIENKTLKILCDAQ